MSVIRLLIALLLALSLSPAVAEDAPPSAPDPQRLSADWWTYFEPAEPLDEQGRGQRFTEARWFLQGYRQRLEKAGEPEQAKLVDKILAEMGRFEELKSAPPPLGKPATAAAESYTLDEALQRYTAWRTLQQEVDAESEESSWQSVIIAEERKQQSRGRNRYLELDEAAPDRLQKGLEQMLSRFDLETQRLELERRKAVLRLAEQRLAMLQPELEAIPGRLVTAPPDMARWQKQQKDADAADKKLREEIDQRQLFDVKLADSARDLSEAQYAVIVAVRKDIEIALNELRSMQARLALDLILFVQDAARIDTDAARKLLAENQELSKTLQQELKRWRRIAERSRSVASASDADSHEDRQAAGLRQRILTTLDGVDQALAFQGVRTLETLHMP